MTAVDTATIWIGGVKAIDINLDLTSQDYSEWIPGEGADIALMRDMETKKVVGARLPMYAKRLIVGGEGLPTIVFDLESGKAFVERKP